METEVMKLSEMISCGDQLIQQLQSQQECLKRPPSGELNLKQRALLARYPSPVKFMTDYNLTLQNKLVKIKPTLAGLALNPNIPSLGLLSSVYGEEMPVEWLNIQFGSLNDFAEVKSKITKQQIYELSGLVLAEYYYLNAAEILYFVARFKMGYYGTFYGAIDPMKITSALMQYVADRRRDIERYERDGERRKRALEMSSNDNNRISYSQYQELRKRADAGDEEAIKLLRKPA